MFKKIVRFFDKAEDKVRGTLSRQPIIYALVGGIGIVLFWKGVWETASLLPFLDGIGSALLGLVLLLMTGLMVSVFIGDSIILSGLKGEKKLAEKTEKEVQEDEDTEERILFELQSIERRLDEAERSAAND